MKFFFITIFVFIFCIIDYRISAQIKKTINPYSAYLFVYFTSNANRGEAIRFAISKDGYTYRALNNNRPVLQSEKISSTGGVRDPHILRGIDGKTFYMVATDMVAANGWNSNRAMVLLKSNDLINWTSAVVNIQKKYTGQDSLLRVWAPQTIYDDVAKKYMIYFSMKNGNSPDKIYYAYANKDFTDLEGEPQQLFFSPDNAACIDGDIEKKDNKYYLFFKTEDRQPGIKIAVSDKLTHDYIMQSNDYVQQTQRPVEGAGTFKLNDGSGYILMYDVYTSGQYQFTKTTDFKQFTVVDKKISMDFHPRHGTVIPITKKESERLLAKWYSTEALAAAAFNPSIKKENISLDTANAALYIPVNIATNISKFNPSFIQFPGVKITPKGSRDFTHHPVVYTFQIANGEPRKYTVKVSEDNNPLFGGLYADPEVLYSYKTNKYYIYPTSDGFTGWSGTYFKTFSSTDLVYWKDEGIILDLNKEVSWAKRNAWAPTIIEKSMHGRFQYFFYFCAAQKIGVAVADDPVGPFIDSGSPIIFKHPYGVQGGQEIDPDVFHDPVSGKDYLYWGNGYMAVAELNKNMISVDTTTVKIVTPDKTFREGTEVFYRNGRYYFLWSENDTRSPDYSVRYGIADSPLGEIKIPHHNIVIEKNTTLGVYGTGHNCILNIPGTDEWYIIYHRFNRPKGIIMGEAAGYNREVCIDRLYFNDDGTIQQVKPTLIGIKIPAIPKL